MPKDYERNHRVGALVVPPKRSTGKSGQPCKLLDERFRAELLLAAANGMSRMGVAAASGLSKTTLHNWLARGKAEPNVEPWGSFAKDYMRAERIMEGVGASTIALEFKRLQQKAQGLGLDNGERGWLSAALAQKFPKEWGASANVGREIDEEPDASAYLQEKGLTEHQLDNMLREPPEEIESALARCAEEVVQRLVTGGWRPSLGLYQEMGQSAYQGGAWVENLAGEKNDGGLK